MRRPQQSQLPSSQHNPQSQPQPQNPSSRRQHHHGRRRTVVVQVIKTMMGLLLIVFGPCIITYFHLYNVLMYYHCHVYRYGSSYDGPGVLPGGGGIQCTTGSGSERVVTLSSSPSSSSLSFGDIDAEINNGPQLVIPPSIAYLTTQLSEGLLHRRQRRRRPSRRMEQQEQQKQEGQQEQHQTPPPRPQQHRVLFDNIPDGQTLDLVTMDYSSSSSISWWSSLRNMMSFTTSSLSSTATTGDTSTTVERKGTIDNNNNNSNSNNNRYGFRTNQNKQQQQQQESNHYHQQQQRKPWPIVPLSTIVWLSVNIGLFVWYWKSKTDPSTVALNKQLLLDDTTNNTTTTTTANNNDNTINSSNSSSSFSDFGRAISGNISHFEIWHLGFNMMTLYNLGPYLERYVYGTIPLLLYTISFLPITTIVVVVLWQLIQRLQKLRQQRHGMTTTTQTTTTMTTNQLLPFPNMVGFSGILFAYMVVATLQNTNQPSCPIPIFPNVCFETYPIHFFSTEREPIYINFGPIVQLIFLQVVLPNVSFLGHLAGIIVGFAWNWQLWIIVPSLEYVQPCVSYPILWFIGKLLLYHRPTWFPVESTINNDENDNGGSNSGGGVGYRLGGTSGGRNPWRRSQSQDNDPQQLLQLRRSSENDGNDDTSSSLQQQSSTPPPNRRLLEWSRTIMMGHLVLLIVVLTKAKTKYVWEAFSSSIVLSQCIMVGMISLLLKSYDCQYGGGSKSEGGGGGGTTSNSISSTSSSSSSSLPLSVVKPFRFGTVGRAYVVFVVIIGITDSMTLGGWIATRVLWQEQRGNQLWWNGLVVAWMIRLLLWSLSLGSVCHMLKTKDEMLNRGIWFYSLGWSVVEPCNSYMTVLERLSILGRMRHTDASSAAISLPQGSGRDSSPRRRRSVQGNDEEEGHLISDVI